MKAKTKAVSFFMALLLLLSCTVFFVMPAGAAGGGAGDQGDARFTKKIVSVVYDNSGSMNQGTEHRYQYARYAIQMLMSTLGQGDELDIVLMHARSAGAGTSNKNVYPVDLADPARNTVVGNMLRSGIFDSPSGTTPIDSVDKAIKQLTDKGLMDKDHLANSLENTEHWLVILTDGEFDEAETRPALEAELKERFSKYPSMKSIFIGFGGNAPDLSGSTLTQEYPFTTYKTDPSNKNQIVGVMQSVSNQLSGRYTLDASAYTVNGSTVTIDLDRYEYSLKNVSAIAQNCGATLTSVSYTGGTANITLPCLIAGDTSALGIQSGYSAVITGDPYMAGGKLTLQYSGVVNPDYFSVLVEPALKIQSYLEYYDGAAWQRATMQYVNANLSGGDRIRVGYEIYEQAQGKPIDVNKVFGGATTAVTYAGKPYNIGEEIPLIVGNNEVAISVSLMGGAYTIYDSFLCIIEENPSFYRVEGAPGSEISFATGKGEAVYTVYVDNVPATKAVLDAYTCTATAKAPDGTAAPVELTIQSDGKVHVVISGIDGNYGDYTVAFKVATEYGISREFIHVMHYEVGTVVMETATPSEVTSANLTPKTKFQVLVDGQKLDKATLEAITFTATVTDPKGNASDVACVYEFDNSLSLTVSIPNLAYGDYVLNVKGSSLKFGDFEATHRLKYYPTSAEVKGEGPKEFGPGQSSISAFYTVYIDGRPISKDQLAGYNWYPVVTKPDGSVADFDCTLQDDGRVKIDMQINPSEFGLYKVDVVLDISEEFKRSSDLGVKNYPTSLALSTLGGGHLSVTQYGMIANQKPIEFKLSADGVDLIFTNGLTSYTLTVGGVDVTQYATVRGNVLSYIPLAEHFGGSPAVSSQAVLLKIGCADMPGLAADASATLDITPTVYEVALLKESKTAIDRFQLGDVDAVLYFAVIRDGVPLPLDELQSEFDAGRIGVKDERGTFGWQFWIPVGQDTSVEEVNGTAAVAFRAKRDWIQPFSTFVAMLILNGDKPVTVTYRDVSYTGAIHFASSSAFAYIWRILVILFTIHVILYVLGFFNGKCKSLPSGIFVTAAISSDYSNVKFRAKKFNCTFWEKYGWHVWRFFPHKKTLWYHQPAKPAPFGRIIFEMDASGNPGFFLREEKVELSSSSDGSQEAAIIDAYLNNLRSHGKGSLPRMKTAVRGRDMRGYFRIQPGADPKLARTRASMWGIYGRMRKDQVETIVFFIKRTHM